MDSYNKDDLIAEYVAQKAEDGNPIKKTQAKDDIDTLLSSIMSVLGQSKNTTPNNKNVRARLTLINFGSIELRHVKARTYNSFGKESSVTPAHNKVVFSEGSLFTEITN